MSKDIRDISVECCKIWNSLKDKTQMIDYLIESKQKVANLEAKLAEAQETNKILSNELTKNTIIKQDHLETCCGIPIFKIPKLKEENEQLKQQLTESEESCILLEGLRKSEAEKKDIAMKRVSELKQQLAEWQDGTIICKWTDAENKVKELKQQLAEKDKEIYAKNSEINKLKCDFECFERFVKQNDALVINANQDKISFCIEKLELLKERLICGSILDKSNGFWDLSLKKGDAYILDDALLDLLEQELTYQIEELKKEMK